MSGGVVAANFHRGLHLNVADLADFSNCQDYCESKAVWSVTRLLDGVLLFARKRNRVIQKHVSTDATA